MNPKRCRLVLATGVLVATGVLALPGTARSAVPGATGKIAFASERDFNFQIYVMNADGFDFPPTGGVR